MSNKKNDIENKKEKLKEWLSKIWSWFSSLSEKISKSKEELYQAKKNFWKKKFLYQLFEDWKVQDYQRFAKNEWELIQELKAEWKDPFNIVEYKKDNKILDFIDWLKDYWSVSLVEIWAFAWSMSLLTRNWMNLVASLKETNDTITNKVFKKKLNTLVEKISSWQKEPHKYFQEFPELFDQTFISIIKTADQNWNYWAAFKEIYEQVLIKIRINKLKRKAKQWPAVNLSVFFGVCILMLTVVFPKLKDLFKNQELPWVTKIFLWTSDFFTNNFILIVLLFILIFFIVRQFMTNNSVRRWFDSLILKFPVIKNAVKNSNMYIFANTFETLWHSWFSSIESLKQLRTSITNLVYLEEIDKMIDATETGRNRSETPITDIMRENAELWRTPTSNMIILVSAWEKVGKIHEPLRKEKDTFLKEYEESINKMIAYINSVVFILTAILVLWLVASIMFPLMSFDPSASRNALQ